jgi:hypothetical protein
VRVPPHAAPLLKQLFLPGWLYKPAGSIYNRRPRCNNYCGRDELQKLGNSKQVNVSSLDGSALPQQVTAKPPAPTFKIDRS